ncbi:MAG: radical SAM family heme chaperone HemW [Candidatus Eremiobacteraeota bacterium]|nr:radical SAM family heme chaperone HemW [Candidatus Eremiobacteraeota bacterium]
MPAPAAIYVHIPFCPYVCPYCDFAKWPYRQSWAERYLDALEAEILAAPQLAGTSLFLGGGTPNTIPAERLVALVRRLRTRFDLEPDAEVTLEVNPDRALCEAFEAYRAAGVNRLSIGVQSFERQELQTLGRRHDASDVAEVTARARAAGFADLSFDLIFAVPGQTLASWQASLDAAIRLEPDHVSTYGLTIESGTPFAAWHACEPGAFVEQDLEAEQYEASIERLTRAGFEHYEISNFAKPGHRSRHNQNYWRNGEYLGLGVGAASFLRGTRSVHTRDLGGYVRAALAGEPIPGTSERLDGPARVGEATMLALRTAEGVDLQAFRERYQIDFLASYDAPIRALEGAGMLEVTPTHVRLTHGGRFVANDVCSEFIA